MLTEFKHPQYPHRQVFIKKHMPFQLPIPLSTMTRCVLINKGQGALPTDLNDTPFTTRHHSMRHHSMRHHSQQDTIHDKTPLFNKNPFNKTPFNKTPVNKTPVNKTPVNKTPWRQEPGQQTTSLYSSLYGVKGLPCRGDVARVQCLISKLAFSARFVFSRSLCQLDLDLWWRIARAICT